MSWKRSLVVAAANRRPGSLKRIFEGRLARRRVVLENMSKVGSLVDHPINEDE